MKHADQSNAALKPGKLTQPLSVRIQTTLKKMGRQWQIQFMALSGVVWMAIFSYIPLIFLVIAFMDYKVSIPLFENQSVGLKHFKAFLTDDRFWRSVVNTLGISALKITIGFVVPIIFALLLNEVKNPKFKKVVQSLSYMPHFISWAIFGGIMLNWMSSTGLINQIMLSLGLQSRSILYNADPDNFWTISFITDTFKETGWSAIIYLAAIAGIDPGLYESAELDGANRWQQIVHVTLPSLLPTIITLTLMSIGKIFYSDFGLFYQVPMDSGPLLDITSTIDTYVYRALITLNDYGRSSAAGVYQSVVGFILVLCANLAVKKIGGEENALF